MLSMIASQLPEITHALFVGGGTVDVDEEHDMRLPLHHHRIEIVSVEHFNDSLAAFLIQRLVHIAERFHFLLQNGFDERFHTVDSHLQSIRHPNNQLERQRHVRNYHVLGVVGSEFQILLGPRHLLLPADVDQSYHAEERERTASEKVKERSCVAARVNVRRNKCYVTE